MGRAANARCAGSQPVGILIRSRSIRGVAEEAPGAYKDVSAVDEAADCIQLSRMASRLEPVICVKG